MASKRSNDRSRSRSPPKRQVRSRRVVVSNIPYDANAKALREAFKEKIGICGQIDMIEMKGKFSGNAVVEFKTIDGAQKAVDEMHKHSLNGREIIVREESSRDREKFGLNNKPHSIISDMGGSSNNIMALIDQLQRDGPITNSLFMANLHYSLTWQKLKDMFKEAGRVKHVDLKVDSDGSSKGYGVVEFESPEEAIIAIHMFNGKTITGRDIKLRMDKSGRHLSGRLDMSWFRNMGDNNSSSDLNPAIRRTFEDLMQAISNPGNNTNQAMKALNELVIISQMFDKSSSSNQQRLPTVETPAFVRGYDNRMSNNPSNMNSGMRPPWNEMSGSSNYTPDYMRPQPIDNYDMPSMYQQHNKGMPGPMSRNGRFSPNNPGHSMPNNNNQNTAGEMALLEDLLTKFKNSDQHALLSVLGSVLGKKGGDNQQNQMSQHQQSSQSSGLNMPPRFNEFSSALSNTLLVKNIPFSFTWKDLKHSFSQAPGIVNTEILRDEFHRSKGIGSVVFQSSSDAQRCKNLMDGTLLDGRPISIEFSHSMK